MGLLLSIKYMSELFEVRDNRRKEMFRIDDEYLNGYAKLCGTNATLVYLCLCRHADRHQESFPSVKLMSDKTGISERSVIRGIATLIEWGIISKERERKKDAKWLNNRYILLDKTTWKSKPSATKSCGSQVTKDTEPSAKYDKSQVPQVHTKDTHKKVTHTTSKQSLQVADLIKLFEAINPACSKMYGNETQRESAKNLINTYGFEEVSKVISLLNHTNKMQYFPSITTPHLLWLKYQDLKNKLEAKKIELQSKKAKVAF